MSKGKVIFCTPSLSGPTAPYIEALEASIPLIKEAGWQEGYAQELGNPYISAARAMMTRKAITAGADVIVYLDYDLSWEPKDLLDLLEADGDCVAGTYRFKNDEESYMGQLEETDEGTPVVRPSDGAIKSKMVPAGFLKVTKRGLIDFARAYPELLYGDPFEYALDLFNHGARNGIWWGEDYSFSVRWREMGGDIWTPPKLNLTHWGKVSHPEMATDEQKATIVYFGNDAYAPFKGNLHEFLLRQPGGSNDPERLA